MKAVIAFILTYALGQPAAQDTDEVISAPQQRVVQTVPAHVVQHKSPAKAKPAPKKKAIHS